MIKLKIIKSADQNQIGDFIFGKNKIIFSNTQKADIKCKTSFALEIADNQLFLLNPEKKVLINNKYSGELSKTQENDLLSIDDFEVRIQTFKSTELLTMKEVLNKNTDYIINNDPDLLKEITILRNELKDA